MNDLNVYFNHEAEASVIGAALQSEKCVKLITETSSDEFHAPEHRILHSCICALAKSQTSVDLVTVNDWLTKNNLIDQVGGVEHLVDIVSFVPSTANAKDYLNIVHACAMRRNLYMIGKELMERAGSSGPPEEAREWAARTVREVKLGESVRLISMMDACMATYGELEKDQNPGLETGNRILSGIESMDSRLGGLHGGLYVAIGARPGVGKSILALTFCVNAAKQGKRVLLSSLEMNETEITERILANEGNVPLNVITSGRIPLDGWDGIGKAISPISNLPLWYCLEATTIDKVRRAAYQLYENGGLDMIAIDYLQLMEATYAKRQNRQEQISEISRGLKILAQELQIPVLVLTQMNRVSVKQYAKGKIVKQEPTINEARESGSIEQDANIFILLHDPDREEMQSELERQTWDDLADKGQTMMRIIVAKNRQGKRGRLTVAFDGDHMRFLPIVRKD